jgi:hypothetical protein
MNMNASLGRGHFAQLYLQAARVRGDELGDFFRIYAETPESEIPPAELESAAEMAGEIAEYLQRVTTYLNEASHLGEANLQRH